MRNIIRTTLAGLAAIGLVFGLSAGAATAADVNPRGAGAVTATADVPKGSITSYHIATDGITEQGDFSDALYNLLRTPAVNTVTQNALRPGIVTEDKLSDGVKAKLNAPDTLGLSGVHADAPYGANLPGQDSSATTIPADSTKVIWTACAPGEAALGGGFRFGNAGSSESFTASQAEAAALASKLIVVASEAAYYKDGGLVNGSETAPVNDNLSFRPNAWAVTVTNTDSAEHGARVWVTCAKVG